MSTSFARCLLVQPLWRPQIRSIKATRRLVAAAASRAMSTQPGNNNRLIISSSRRSNNIRTLVQRCAYSSSAPRAVSITYIEANGTEKTVDAPVGMNLLDVAHENNIELEGACGGELACSTCHLVFEQDVYDTLPLKEDEEEDMLDLAFEVTETSRLGCQIVVREDFEGIKVRIPDDGF